MIAARPHPLEGEGSNTDLIAELRLRLVIAKVGAADVIKFDVSDLEAVIAALAAAPVASKGEALPVPCYECGTTEVYGPICAKCNPDLFNLPASDKGEEADVWARIGADDRLKRARQRLSLHELRMIVDHARARPSPGVSREEVARIIDPNAYAGVYDQKVVTGFVADRRASAEGRADLVLAILSRGKGS